MAAAAHATRSDNTRSRHQNRQKKKGHSVYTQEVNLNHQHVTRMAIITTQIPRL
jgi:hypothetical protein